MSEERIWVVHFKDNRTGREGSQNFDNERDYRSRIESIKSDHWLAFIRGVRPNGEMD